MSSFRDARSLHVVTLWNSLTGTNCPLSRFLTATFVVAILSLVSTTSAEDRFQSQTKEDRVDVLDSGRLVTSYHFRSGSKPILWPLMGPDEQRFSREYPMVPDSKDEEHDHPHHRSLWMSFGEVNEFDLWAEGKGKGTICHVGVPQVAASSEGVRIEASHLWKEGRSDVSSVSLNLVDGCEPSTPTLAECKASYWIHGDARERMIDCSYLLKAHKDLHFGDTKEGMFGIRVPEPMRADKRGGHILTSEGKRDGASWGFPAKWVDYSGNTSRDGSKIYGVAILVHPNSFRADGRWHVRTYGLFAHNPFGVKDFPKMENPPKGDQEGGYFLKQGESMQFQYRVVLHSGAWTSQMGDQHWEEYSK